MYYVRIIDFLKIKFYLLFILHFLQICIRKVKINLYENVEISKEI